MSSVTSEDAMMLDASSTPTQAINMPSNENLMGGLANVREKCWRSRDLGARGNYPQILGLGGRIEPSGPCRAEVSDLLANDNAASIQPASQEVCYRDASNSDFHFPQPTDQYVPCPPLQASPSTSSTPAPQVQTPGAFGGA
ncbi:hypothetical protein BU16DRAFT_557412 [Lophium mytilinum]|uniref:Uncharacterized protein n=1 Tax=Lophium mytilinum TaxID=390894 RepID=A0A6A6R3F2_9PEZI|nr:hypothetical protein BU16DRAFT_557412 [Lophium mytilinum]